MKWKHDARKRPTSTDAFRRSIGEATASLASGPIRMINGKPCVMWTHVQDFVDSDENGEKSVVASMTFRQGEYIFPKAYLHPKKMFVGETKDARFTRDRGWQIYLDAVLRDKSGHPVLVDGLQVDLAGWYLESELQDAELGMEMIRLGSTNPSVTEIQERRAQRARKSLALSKRDCG